MFFENRIPYEMAVFLTSNQASITAYLVPKFRVLIQALIDYYSIKVTASESSALSVFTVFTTASSSAYPKDMPNKMP